MLENFMNGGATPCRACVGIDRVQPVKAQNPLGVEGEGIGLQPVNICDGDQLRADGCRRHRRGAAAGLMTRWPVEGLRQHGVTISAFPLRTGHGLQAQPEAGGYGGAT